MRPPRTVNIKLHSRTHRLVKVIALRMYAEHMIEEDVCKLAGISKDTWFKIKLYGRTPSLPVLEALAQVVGLRLELKPHFEDIYGQGKDKSPKQGKLQKLDKGEVERNTVKGREITKAV